MGLFYSTLSTLPLSHLQFFIPILTQEGLVENLVGYSKSADERYIYGTSLYYRRRDTLWGLEKLHLAYDMGYAILTDSTNPSWVNIGITNLSVKIGLLLVSEITPS